MQTITTKYLGPSNCRGSRIKATSSGGHSLTQSLEHDCSIEQEHCRVAKALKDKLKWSDKTMIGGHTQHGMVFVFADSAEYTI